MSIVLSGSLILTGSISASGNLTTLGTITAQTLVVQTITSSIVNLTGSNIFGSTLSNSQTFTGSVNITGSLTVNTTGTEFQVTNAGVVLGNLLADNHSVTGSLRVTGSISGSLFGTSSQAVSSSYALTASFALTAGGASGFPFTGSASITGSFRVSGSTNISASAYALQLLGSGSSVFSVDGTVGRLFEVDDSLSGSLFSVNTAAGLPVIEAFSDNTVRIGQFGQRALFVSQSRVGVGTETPTSILEAQVNQNAQTGIRVRNSTAGTSAGVEFGAYTNSGNGGFGKYSTGNTPYKNISAASTYIYNGASGDIALLNDVAGGNISFAAGGVSTAQMFISASGNVGIGTTTPNGLLQCNGSAIIGSGTVSNGTTFGGGGQVNRLKVESGNYTCLEVNGSTSGGSIQFTYGSNLPNQVSALIGYNYASGTVNELAISNILSGPMILATNNTERVRITSAGNVGFNTTSPTGSRATNLVQVAGSLAVLRVGPWFSTDDRDFVEIQADGANTRLYSPNEDFSFHNPVGNANITGSNINLCATGNINFRTTAGGSNTLNVYAANAGGANASLYLEAAGVVGGGMYQDRGTSTLRVWQATSTVGVSLANNATSWGSFSDERMKDIIEPITNAVDKVNTLRAVIGKYKTDEEDKRRPFLIAQDVQAILPEAIYDDKSEDKFLSLSYTDVIPLLVASIKELTAKVTALENK